MNTKFTRDEVRKVAVVGAGVMGEAIISTLINSKYRKDAISFVEKRDDRAQEVAAKYGISRASLAEAATSDLIFLVTKPQDLESAVEQLASGIKSSSLLVSLAAGKKTSAIEKLLQGDNPVIRVMPNTPLLIGSGISAISPGKYARQEHLLVVTELFQSAGSTILIDETLQDAVTATSGSGPAYFFLFIESMIDGGKQLGLSEADARLLAISTIKGAAAMLEKSGKSPATLRENVTSPKGTTAAALSVFDESDLRAIVAKAMKAARDRSVELG